MSTQRWHHRPAHLFVQNAFYFVTARTTERLHHFRGDERLSLLQDCLFRALEAHKWQLQAWAILL